MMEGEGEVTIEEVELGTPAEGSTESEGKPPPPAAGAEGAEATPAANPDTTGAPAAETKKSLLDGLLTGERVPDAIAFYRDQALETETEFTEADLEELSPRAQVLLATILARQQKARGSLETFAGEQTAKVDEAKAALKQAEQARANQLEFTKGAKVAEQRRQAAAVLADRTPLDPEDPNYAQRLIDRAVAAKLMEWFTAIDDDAAARDQAVKQTSLDEQYETYRQGFERFRDAHKAELYVEGQKETLQQFTGQYDDKGQPVFRAYAADKRSPLMLRVEAVLKRYGPHPDDKRRFRMSFDEAYTLALHELDAEGNKAESDASMARARERVIRPTARKVPELKPPPSSDPAALADFMAKNPKWAEERVRRQFAEDPAADAGA